MRRIVTSGLVLVCAAWASMTVVPHRANAANDLATALPDNAVPPGAIGQPGTPSHGGSTDVASPSQPSAQGCLDLGHNSQPILAMNIGETDRSVAVDINARVSVGALGIRYESGAEHQLECIIRQIDGNVRGQEFARAVIQVPPGGGLVFHDVPLVFTFNPGTRYDIAFQATPDFGFNVHNMEFYLFNNPNMDPNLGYDVGPFKVLDGGADRASGYQNSVMPHIQACEGQHETFCEASPKKVKAVDCDNCPAPGLVVEKTDRPCTPPGGPPHPHCPRGKVKGMTHETICPDGLPGLCQYTKFKFNRVCDP